MTTTEVVLRRCMFDGFASPSARLACVLLGASALLGCSKNPEEDDDQGPAPIVITSLEAVCRLDAGPFSATIDNPWFPMPAGQALTLDGEEDGATVHLVITSFEETFDVAGVATRRVEERESQDGELVEVSQNYFAQAADGTVCYFGEDVDIYEAGAVTAHDGAWLAGDGVNQPGINMPANPTLGMSYAQEVAPGLAEDHADHIAENESTTVPYGTFEETIRVREWSTLEPDSLSMKIYAKGVGLLVDDGIELGSVEMP